MAPVIVASTPSPPPGIRTPPTPKHGPSDPWEPYSPRKSTRISAQRTAHRTPPPRNTSHHPAPAPAQSARKSHNKSQVHTSTAGMVSPSATPRKKAQSSTMGPNSHVSGRRLTAESAAIAAANLGLDEGKKSGRQTNISHASGMLPTPAKTPQKAPVEKKPGIEAIARNLFASDEDMASPKKKRATKKYTGISMDSFTAEDVEEPIEIFTDSRERIPTKDESTDNPFYGDSAPVVGEPIKRRSKRRQVHVPGEGRQTVDEAMKREDGMVYVFRGKKIFRKFGEPEPADPEKNDAEREGSPTRKPTTRSSMQPRLLFPPKHTETTVDDEEADTDVEDQPMRDEAELTEAPETPQSKVNEKSQLETPQAPRFAPASPPDTRRVTRAGGKRLDDDTPIKRRASTSPFDSWPRVKSRSDNGLHAKRAGSSLASGTTKKARA